MVKLIPLQTNMAVVSVFFLSDPSSIAVCKDKNVKSKLGMARENVSNQSSK